MLKNEEGHSKMFPLLSALLTFIIFHSDSSSANQFLALRPQYNTSALRLYYHVPSDCKEYVQVYSSLPEPFHMYVEDNDI